MHIVTLPAFLKTCFLVSAVTALYACGGGGGTSSGGASNSAGSSASSTASSDATSSSSESSSSVSSSSVASSSSQSSLNKENCAYGGSAVLLSAAATRIELENYDVCDTSFSDTTAANEAGAYREDSVDIAAGGDSSQGYYVSNMQAGEYLEYSVDVSRSGLYSVAFRARTTSAADARLSLSIDGEEVGNSSVSIATDAWSDHTKTVYLADGEQVLRVRVDAAGAEADYLEFSYAEPTVVSAQEAVEAMGIGINMGNTLDAPQEGAWAPAAEKHYFSDYKAAGFNHVRVPVTWDAHTDTAEPYAIDADFLERVEQIIDWALAEGYYVILNAHHETWLKTDYQDAANRARFDAIWTQLAERFQAESSRLVFEILNEPVGMTLSQANELNARILPIIRRHNPERLVVFSGNDYTGADTLIATAVPDDAYVIGNFHSYDPWEFAGQCIRTWGSQADRDELAALYQRVKAWSQEHGVPVMLNEFGAAHYDYTQPENVCQQSSRLAYLQTHVNLATENGFAATVWDDGGAFVIYHREDRTWEEEKDILVGPNP